MYIKKTHDIYARDIIIEAVKKCELKINKLDGKYNLNRCLKKELVAVLTEKVSRSIFLALWEERLKGQSEVLVELKKVLVDLYKLGGEKDDMFCEEIYKKYIENLKIVKKKLKRDRKSIKEHLRFVKETLNEYKEAFLRDFENNKFHFTKNFIYGPILNRLSWKERNEYKDKLDLFFTRMEQYLNSFLWFQDITFVDHFGTSRYTYIWNNFFNNADMMNSLYGIIKEVKGSVYFVDIGDLKLFNEILSHSFWNFILAKVIMFLDTMAFSIRCGWDEFVLFNFDKDDEYIISGLSEGIEIRLSYFEKLFKNNWVSKDIISVLREFKNDISDHNFWNKEYALTINKKLVKFIKERDILKYEIVNEKKGKWYFFVKDKSLYLKVNLSMDMKKLNCEDKCELNFYELFKKFRKR